MSQEQLDCLLNTFINLPEKVRKYKERKTDFIDYTKELLIEDIESYQENKHTL